MKKVKELIKKLWKFADGNKTIFGLLLLEAIQAGLIPLTGGWLIFVKGVIWIFTGASLAHHIKKGYFSTKKGN